VLTLAENTRTAVNATIKRATFTAHKLMDKLDVNAIGELEAVYKQSAANIASRLAQHAGPDGNLALQEMRSALAQINGELGRLADLRNTLLNTTILQAANLGVQPYTQVVNGIYATLTPDAGMRVANDAVRFVRSFVAEDGLQLSDRIWRLDAQARDLVTNAVERAVIQGHGAAQAAAEFLAQQVPVPKDIAGKINSANANAIGKTVKDALLKDSGNPMDNAMRVMRTEINRAHGEAYMKGGEDHPDFGGWRYLLSPAHPKPDICDLLSTQNLYGLGEGVYPDRQRLPWPAHPNTLSYIEIVFKDEITEADKNGKETPIAALGRLTPEQQGGVLGKGKHDIFKRGMLTQGMIRSPLSSVKTRITSLEKTLDKKRIAEKAAAAKKEAAKAAAAAALKAAEEKAKQAAAQLQIDAIANSKKGYAWQALNQLSKTGSLDLQPAERLEKINLLAADIAAKKQISNALGKYKKAIITGKEPPPHSLKAFEALSDAEKKVITDAIDKAKAAAAQEALASGQIRFADFERIGPQQGSNPGGLYRHKGSGEQWYIKTPASEDFARNEVLANRLYKAAGVDVADVRLIDVNGKASVASKIIDGLKADRAGLAAGRVSGAYEGYATDAWLANWDVAGMNFDNMLVKEGKAWRIDAGGALRYRAQGGLKGKEWGAVVQELETLRNAQTNPQTATVFGKMTKAQLEASAQRLRAVSDDEIRAIVKEFGPVDAKDNAKLAEILIARKQDILRKVAPDASPLPLPADAASRVTVAEHKLIQESRINGLGIVTDKGQIEDQQVLVWVEKAVDGSPRTVGQFKVTVDAGNELAKVARVVNSGPDFDDGGLYNKFVEAIKGVASQAAKGEALRQKDIDRVKALGPQYVKMVNGLKGNPQQHEFAQHYAGWIKALDDAIAPGVGNVTQWKPGGKLLAEFQFKPVKAAPSETGLEFSKLAGKFTRKKIERGFATATDTLNLERGYFYEADVSGTRVRYWPDRKDVPFALRNQVEIVTAGESRDSAQRIFDTIKSLGIDSSRPLALDREELYLRQIAYHRRDGFAEFNSAAGAAKTQQARVDAMKAWLNTATGQDITKSPFYNPEGSYQAFGQGRKHVYRPDLLGKDWDKFQGEFALYHHITQNGMVNSLKSILNSGGHMAPTVEKLRRGLPIGGMSPDQDLETGGASYTFTRIRRLESAIKSEGLVWKPRSLARLDAISYSSDMYGRVTGNTVIQNRKTGIAEWRQAAKGGSNETILKNGLSIFDDLQHIMVSPGDLEPVLKLFRSHGYSVWPDGRALNEVVKAVGSI
jgi:hypothetical protein